jgi:hypothetical protein
MGDTAKERVIPVIWVTDHAISGQVSIHRDVLLDESGNSVDVANPGDMCCRYVYKPHWHETREAAVERVRVMKAKRIKSLSKQLAELEKLDPEKLVPQ